MDAYKKLFVSSRKDNEGGAAPLHSRPVWAEVSLAALAHNFAAIKDYVNPLGEKRKAPRKVLSIVKAMATGMAGHKWPRHWRKRGRTGSA